MNRLLLLTVFLLTIACGTLPTPTPVASVPTATGTAYIQITPKVSTTPTVIHTLTPKCKLRVTASVLNVRSCPSTGCAVVSYKYAGDFVEGWCRVDGWCQVGNVDAPAWIWGGCAGLEGFGCE